MQRFLFLCFHLLEVVKDNLCGAPSLAIVRFNSYALLSFKLA